MKVFKDRLSENRQDSFWYEGLIATGEFYSLYAVGDIEFLYDDEKFKDYHAVELADNEGWTDNDLADVEWLANNWFEIILNHTGESIIVDNQTFDGALSELLELEETIKKSRSKNSF